MTAAFRPSDVLILRTAFAVLIAAASWPALWTGTIGMLVGGMEIAGAALFVFEAMWGGTALFAVFASAFALHAPSGELPLHLPIYAVATIALMRLTRARQRSHGH